MLESGFIGNVSHHLTANDLTTDQLLPSLFGPGNTQMLRPFPQFSNVTMVNPAIGNSTYYAGYFKAEKRFSKGFSFLAHYTFSKFIDDVASGDEYGDPGSYMNQYNRQSGQGAQRLGCAAALPPVPRSTRCRSSRNSRALNFIAGGWQLGLYQNVQSGATFTVYDSANTTNGFPAGTVRPNLFGDPWLSSGSTLQHYFNTAAFVHPPNYQFGGSPRSVLRGPGSDNVDFSAGQDIPVTERFRTELRGEFFNVFNFANFNIPGPHARELGLRHYQLGAAGEDCGAGAAGDLLGLVHTTVNSDARVHALLRTSACSTPNQM